MPDQITDDELAAAIVAVIGDKKRDGLSPQGEAAVRLAMNHAHVQTETAKTLAKAPKVEIVKTLNEPTTCKVWINGVLEFNGRDRSTDLREPGRLHVPADQHYPIIPDVTTPVGEILDEEPEPNQALRDAAQRHREDPAFEQQPEGDDKWEVGF